MVSFLFSSVFTWRIYLAKSEALLSTPHTRHWDIYPHPWESLFPCSEYGAPFPQVSVWDSQFLRVDVGSHCGLCWYHTPATERGFQVIQISDLGPRDSRAIFLRQWFTWHFPKFVYSLVNTWLNFQYLFKKKKIIHQITKENKLNIELTSFSWIYLLKIQPSAYME